MKNYQYTKKEGTHKRQSLYKVSAHKNKNIPNQKQMHNTYKHKHFSYKLQLGISYTLTHK